MKKYICILLLMLLLLSGCQSTGEEKPLEDEPYAAMNWMHFKKMAMDDSYYYISDDVVHSEEMYRLNKVKRDGTTREVLLDTGVSFLWDKDDWLYFVAPLEEVGAYDNPYRVYKMKKDGTELTQIEKAPSSAAYLYGEKLYYLAELENAPLWNLCAYDITTGEKKSFPNVFTSRFMIQEDWLYYLEDSTSILYRMHTKTYDIETLWDKERIYGSVFNMIDNALYTNWKRYNLDTAVVEDLSGGGLGELYFKEGAYHIDYKPGTEENTVCYTDYASGETQVFDVPLIVSNNYLMRMEDWLYFHARPKEKDSVYHWYRIRIDGSGLEKVELSETQ